MKSVISIITAVILAVSTYNAMDKKIHPVEILTSFKSFAETHKKSYSTPAEYLYRLSVFTKNYLDIKRHNNLGTSFTLGINQFADLTTKEMSAMYIGSSGTPKEAVKKTNIKDLSLGQAQEEVDWVEAGFVNPVLDQGRVCNGGWAFAAIGVVEAANFIKYGSLVGLSQQEIFDCSGASYLWDPCDGGSVTGSFRYIKKYGIMLGEDYPYTSQDEQCMRNRDKKTDIKITNVTGVEYLSREEMEQAVSQNPVAISITSDNAWVRFYKDGVLDPVGSCGRSSSNDHKVLIVGYGTDSVTGKDYWVVKNSWGTGWGKEGYMWVYRGEANSPSDRYGVCGIRNWAAWVTLA